MSSNRLNASRQQPVTGGGKSGATPLREDAVHLCAHFINNLPKTMQQLDPTRIAFELVIQATVKYYLEKGGQIQAGSVARLEMPSLNVPFSPSSILFRKERFSVDFDTLRGSDLHFNRALWRYPVPPPNIKIIYEIFVGVKERRVGSSTSSWVSSGQQGASSASDPQGFRFLVPADTVMDTKLATRLIGLSIGQVALTISVPTPDSPVFSSSSALARLSALYHKLKPRLPPTYSLDEEVRAAATGGTSSGGGMCFDETLVYSKMRKLSDPNFYKNRLEKLVNLYMFDNPNRVARVQQLLSEYQGKEELMIRNVVMELGPELSSILPRHRMTAFQKKFRVADADVAFAFPDGVYSLAVVESDPEAIFDILRQRFGNEPRPTSYLFPPVAYEPDRRAYIMEHLVFPVNKPGRNSRDIALQARQRRPPFVNTPTEREINKTSRSGRVLSEIEILQEKHDPEFKQIIPAVADALTNVIAQHAKINTRDDRFTMYETNNVPNIQLEDYIHRTGEYTYISPSSMLAAVIFLDRLCERYPLLTLTNQNIFKLFFVSVRIASKIVDLRSLNNKNFASVGGVGNRHLNDLEDGFLKYIKFDLFLSPQEFSEYSRRLNPPLAHAAIRQIAESPDGQGDDDYDQQRQQQVPIGDASNMGIQ